MVRWADHEAGIQVLEVRASCLEHYLAEHQGPADRTPVRQTLADLGDHAPQGMRHVRPKAEAADRRIAVEAARRCCVAQQAVRHQTAEELPLEDPSVRRADRHEEELLRRTERLGRT